MKKITLAFIILNSSLIFSQAENIVINESFSNNSNNWVLSTKNHWNSSINNGSYNLSNNNSDKTSYFKPKNLFLNNKQNYEIETNIKFTLSENNSSSGLIFICDEQVKNDSYSLLLGYLVMVMKYNDEYFLHLNKADWSGFNYYEKLNNFDISKTHNLKIIVDNETPAFRIFIDNKLVFEKKFPLFNFNNIGFYQMGKVSMVVNDIKIKTSNSENSKFMFDQTDLVYNESKNITNTLKGSQYLTDLTKYVPKGILFDDYNNQFKRFKEELLIDENCENFNTIPTKDEVNDAFIFNYKSNKFFTLVSKENTFIATSITFSAPNKAVEFYNLYSKSKGYKIGPERAYLPINEMKAIMLNKEENSVTIFY